jgi:ABC-type amino acid transport system permease subunit
MVGEARLLFNKDSYGQNPCNVIIENLWIDGSTYRAIFGQEKTAQDIAESLLNNYDEEFPMYYNGSTLYVEVVRGIPLMVLIFYIAYGLFPIIVNLIGILGDWGLTFAPTSGFFQSLSLFNIRAVSQEGRAIIALGVAYGAFEAEVFRAGIQSISKGQMEAASQGGLQTPPTGTYSLFFL